MSTSTINNEGAAFLKTATASPDFENLPLEGIPDSYSGPTFVKKDFIYTTVEAKAGETTYFLMTPTAGVAYYHGSNALGPNTDPIVFRAQPSGQGGIFPDASSLFPGVSSPENIISNTGEIVQGRIISHAAEIVCVNNSFNQYGTITTLKTPLVRSLIESRGLFGEDVAYQVMGAEPLVKTTMTSEANVTPVRDGSYAVAMSKEADFNFYSVLDDIGLTTTFPGYIQNTPSPNTATFTGPSVVWDNGFDTIMFRVQVPPTAPDAPVPSQAFILKVWRCWEFKPAAASLASSIAHSSPPLDENTINIYHAMSKELPVSVPVRDNPDFWDTLVSTMTTGAGMLADLNVPGAKGVHAVGRLVSGLVHKGSDRRTARRAGRRARKSRPKKKKKGRRKRR